MTSFPIQATTLHFLEEVLSTLDNDGQEGLLNDAKTMDSVFFDAGKNLNLVSKDLDDIRVALLSFAVIAEIDYYALGKEGDDLSSFVRKMCSLKTDVDQIKSAKSFLKRATNHISLGKAKTERALELLDKVITKATKAMNKSKKVDTSLKKNIIVHTISYVEELICILLEENDVNL